MKNFLLLALISASLFANCTDVKEEMDNIQKLLPLQVDKDIVATKVFCEDNTMTYLFELDKQKKYGWSDMSQKDIEEFKEDLKPLLIKQYCTDPDFDSNRKYSVALRYIYKLQGGKTYSDMTINNKDCK